MRRAVFLLLASLAACGDSEKTGPLRVEIVVASADGAAPPGTALRSADGKRTLPLVPSKDSPASLAADGPAGKWFVVPPPGWGVVGTTEALSLQPGLAPTPVPIGRRHSIYLEPPPGLPIGDVEVLPEVENASPLTVERAGGADGRVAVRLAAAAWHDVVRVTAVVGGGLISRPSRVTLAAGGAPVGSPLYLDTAASLDVRLFRPEDGKPASGVEVRVTGSAGRLTFRSEVRTDADGIARFPALSAMAPRVSISHEVPGGSRFGIELTAADWRQAGEARILLWTLTRPPNVTGRPAWLEVSLPETSTPVSDPIMVQFRPPGAATYAVASALQPERAWQPGSQASFIWPSDVPPAGGRAYVRMGVLGGLAEDRGGGAETKRLVLEPLCALRARVGATQGVPHGVRVVCRRKEGAEEVLAQGWSLVAALPSLVDVQLPLGTYRICVLDGTHEGRSVTWTFDKPGSQAQIDLVPP